MNKQHLADPFGDELRRLHLERRFYLLQLIRAAVLHSFAGKRTYFCMLPLSDGKFDVDSIATALCSIILSNHWIVQDLSVKHDRQNHTITLYFEQIFD